MKIPTHGACSPTQDGTDDKNLDTLPDPTGKYTPNG
jgi:hypothetical protein